MLASLIKYFAVIVVLPALLLASVLTMVFYGVDSKEETLPTIALLLPGKISDPGWNRSIYLDVEKAFVQSGIAEIAVVQGVSLDNVAQAVDSVRKRDIHAVILGFDKSDKRIERVIAANTQMRFAGLFKTFDFYGNYSSTEGSNIDGGKKSGGTPVCATLDLPRLYVGLCSGIGIASCTLGACSRKSRRPVDGAYKRFRARCQGGSPRVHSLCSRTWNCRS